MVEFYTMQTTMQVLGKYEVKMLTNYKKKYNNVYYNMGQVFFVCFCICCWCPTECPLCSDRKLHYLTQHILSLFLFHLKLQGYHGESSSSYNTAEWWCSCHHTSWKIIFIPPSSNHHSCLLHLREKKSLLLEGWWKVEPLYSNN